MAARATCGLACTTRGCEHNFAALTKRIKQNFTSDRKPKDMIGREPTLLVFRAAARGLEIKARDATAVAMFSMQTVYEICACKRVSQWDL